jgi:hypothetical protein
MPVSELCLTVLIEQTDVHWRRLREPAELLRAAAAEQIEHTSDW